MLKEGEDVEEVLITIPPTPPPSEPIIPQHWPSLLATLSKMQGEGIIIRNILISINILQSNKRVFVSDVFSALQEIEHLSSRKPSVLESVTDNIAELLVSPQSNIRSLAHTLLARALKHRPESNTNILSAFQRCLDSSRADILMSALEKLPEIVLCMQGKLLSFLSLSYRSFFNNIFIDY